jgi:hypothetical protein
MNCGRADGPFERILFLAGIQQWICQGNL